jgi:putative hemolysin
LSSNSIPWVALAGAGISMVIGSLFAGADTAVTSLTSTRLGALIEQSSDRDRSAYERIQRGDAKLRSRYLVGRIASTAITAVFFHAFFEAFFGPLAVYAALGATVTLTATLFEIATSLSRKHADSIAAISARYLRPLEFLILPLAVPLGLLGAALSKRDAEKTPDPKVTEAEVEAMVEEGERSGLFGHEPAAMIRNVLEFAERTARDVMIPRVKMEGIELSTPLERVLQIVTESGHSRYPVYREQLDNVAGLLYAKDLFKVLEEHRLKNTSLKEIIRHPANFVAESQSLSSLLKEMRARREHLAIVVDEFGGVSGIVTLEDVLEEIVGDIKDEHDEAEEPSAIQDLGDGRLLADATVSMRELCAYLGADLGTEIGTDTESLGGMLMHHLGKVPEVGTAVSRFGLHFIVRDSDDKQIGKVEIIRA